ncbi:PREDICTED: uncharacterized protein LOC104789625 [Camelina sativa]|uniref:Uncharacterized protein LOC104789625 n=1 Tax=Camelina sativa TaxID=90675 RepID=A0ABM0ZC42_CAMSA|nr:PREDICTED: uncharacterized protein LOC104789625 [Camelina sativa]
MDVSTYYTALLTLWEEHKNYVELPVCTCGRCECDAAAKWERLQQRSRVTKFLMGLNESYDQARRHILMLKPIPTIEEAFNMVTQDERQVVVKPTTSIDSVAFQSVASMNEAESAYVAVYNTGRTIQKPICSHCGKVGHTIQKCYKLHGFPPGYKTNAAEYNYRPPNQFQPRMPTMQSQPRLSQQTSNQMVPYANSMQKANAVAQVYYETGMFPTEDVSYGSVSNQYPQFMVPNGVPSSLQGFTPQQIDQMVSQYKGQFQVQEPIASSSGSSIPSAMATISEHGLMAETSTSDSGSSSHVCSNLDLFTDLRPVTDITVTLPNGTRELSQGLMIGRGRVFQDLYILATENTSLSPSFPAACSFSASVVTDDSLWHQRLGHPSHLVLQKLVSLIPSLKNSSLSSHCSICPLAKQKRLAYVSHGNLADKPFDLVHLDIWGPFSIESVEVFLINRMPRPVLANKSPYELLLTKLPDYSLLKRFGCLCYVSTNPHERNKFSPRARPCVFLRYPVGYKEYKVMDLESNAISISRNVVFQEDVFPFKTSSLLSSAVVMFPNSVLPLPVPLHFVESMPLIDEDSLVPTLPYAPSLAHDHGTIPADTASTSVTDHTSVSSVKPKRQSRAPSYLSEYHCSLVPSISSLPQSPPSSTLPSPLPPPPPPPPSLLIKSLPPSLKKTTPYPLSSVWTLDRYTPLFQSHIFSYCAETEPKTFHQAMNSEKWTNAANDELFALELNKTFVVESLPAGKHAIRCK